MKFQNYLKTHSGMTFKLNVSTMLIGGLVFSVLLLVTMVFSKDQRVVIQPFTITQESWVESDESSISYKESWGLALALLLGNVTPSNVDFIKLKIAPLLSPKIYTDVMLQLESKSEEFKNEKITVTFQPRDIYFENKSKKVFVVGYQYAKGAGSDEPDRELVTFEFLISIKAYLPVIDDLTTYKGRPVTVDDIEKQELLEQRKKQREKKKA